MDIPLELSFHNMEPSDALKAAVEGHVAKLEQLHDHVIGCRVAIEMPHKSHRLGSNAPDVRLVVRVPGREIVVSRELAHSGNKKTATDAYSVLDNAFATALKQLKDYRRQIQGETKPKDVPLTGHVAEIVAERKYGFITAPDGGQIYFHRNSVADEGFDALKVGDTVEYAAVMGDKGPAAARVWRTEKANQNDPLASENRART
ncbi:MAG TPA: HPF/RaiA family ribosome-associated protein [Rhizomicrobium sp.]|jgi:cold shock CspA family protein|nr:HPF/RaiA family ribosome-associated protein [Rhizomicrobium sp.]